jgi:DNA-binding CsgD family transcriptional regulator
MRSKHLTPRELEVASRVAAGASNKVIARELGISIRTVEVHRAMAMEKLGASNTAELTSYFMVSSLGEAGGRGRELLLIELDHIDEQLSKVAFQVGVLRKRIADLASVAKKDFVARRQ